MSTQPKRADELALEAYKELVGLVKNEDTLLWSRTQVFLIINGAMVTALGVIRPQAGSTASPNQSSLTAFYLLFCAVGAITSLLWLATVIRTESVYNHFVEHLKYLEKHYLSPIKIFRVADEYFATGRIKLGDDEFDLPRRARIIPMYLALQLAAAAFFVVWVFLAAYLAR